MTSSSQTWIERVKEADAEAESAFVAMNHEWHENGPEANLANAAYAIAAELRAARLAARPGGGR